ncbi:hypothetical protein EZS27_024745 [termite gut metagenome]|uniref:DUF4160 domain-containing protein n=1 Tax=termite gut metagenome TaxID=433724 RepID=A0A5J4QXW0_9ZZZZ
MIAWIANFDSITGIDVFIDGKAKEKHQFTYLHEIQDEINNLNLIAIMDLNDHKSKFEKLQDDFATIDLLTSGKGLLLEVLLKKILPIEFRMEPDTHKTPHLHISYGKQKHAASYSLKSGERIVGELDSKYDKTVKIWIEKHKDSLLQIWNELQKGDQKGYELLISAL